MTTDLSALLAERAACAARVDAIDAELEKHGIRVVALTPRTREVHAAILVALAERPLGIPEIGRRTGQGAHACSQMLHLMVKSGELRRPSRGVYALPREAGR